MTTAITAQTFLRLQRHKPLNIDEFCKAWIPKLYGIQQDEYGYRKACVTELARLLEGTITRKGIDKNWKWTSGVEEYPAYVKPLLTLADQRYKIMEALGVLPRYDVEES